MNDHDGLEHTSTPNRISDFVLILTGSIVGSTVTMIVTMHPFDDPEEGEEDRTSHDNALRIVHVVWALTLWIAFVKLCSILYRRKGNNGSLNIALTIAGILNLVSSFWYLSLLSRHAQVPVYLWLLSSVPCCLWISLTTRYQCFTNPNGWKLTHPTIPGGGDDLLLEPFLVSQQ